MTDTSSKEETIEKSLVEARANKNELDGDLTERRKDDAGSAYLDDVEAIKQELARANVEGRPAELGGFSAASLGAAGVNVVEFNTDSVERSDENTERGEKVATASTAKKATASK